MQEAIQATLAAIERRARLYRRTVMTVVAIALASPAAALLLRSWHPLAGWILLVPVVGGFFVLDARLVQSWQALVLGIWAAGEVELGAFAKAIAAYPNVPSETLAAMLVALPPSSAMPLDGRRAVVRRVAAGSRSQQARTVWGTTALTAVLICLATAAWRHTTTFALAAVVPLGIWTAVKLTSSATSSPQPSQARRRAGSPPPL